MPRRDELIAAALARRLAEVERGGVDPASETGSTPGAADPEEALRLAMVRLWPPVAAGGASEAELSVLVDGLLAIRTAAAGPDLRYLDAWNNGYEAVAANAALHGSAAARRLTSAYADLLRGQLSRLGR